jgi:hypothetical protein
MMGMCIACLAWLAQHPESSGLTRTRIVRSLGKGFDESIVGDNLGCDRNISVSGCLWRPERSGVGKIQGSETNMGELRD